MSIKKFIVGAVAVLGLSVAAHANMPSNAIGLRVGGGSLLGGELNYQKSMGSNRLELGGSFNFEDENDVTTNYIGAIGIYQWHWNITGGFNWYAGLGAGAGFWSWDANGADDSGLYVDVGGQVGIEYNFNVSGVPLILSIDIRPMFGVIDDAGFGYNGALGIRYTF